MRLSFKTNYQIKIDGQDLENIDTLLTMEEYKLLL